MEQLSQPQVVALPRALLKRAEWNYKTDGTEEQIAKLMQSIAVDRSAGVLAVRELGDGSYEVIDGNHRLTALERLGWEQVQCENFGAISLARAITVARRRNFQWFDDDTLKFAELFRDNVLPEIPLDDLVTFMPESREELENLSKLLEFNWQQFNKDEPPGDGKETVKLSVTPEVHRLWTQWCERAKALLGYDSPEKAFEYAIVEALNIPEESLKR